MVVVTVVVVAAAAAPLAVVSGSISGHRSSDSANCCAQQ